MPTIPVGGHEKHLFLPPQPAVGTLCLWGSKSPPDSGRNQQLGSAVTVVWGKGWDEQRGCPLTLL